MFDTYSNTAGSRSHTNESFTDFSKSPVTLPLSSLEWKYVDGEDIITQPLSDGDMEYVAYREKLRDTGSVKYVFPHALLTGVRGIGPNASATLENLMPPKKKRPRRPKIKQTVRNPYYASGYLDELFDLGQKRRIVNRILRTLRCHIKKTPFDAIVVRGLSGMLIGPEIAARMDLPLIVCRKGESSHGNSDIEMSRAMYLSNPSLRYVILDDFICSGETVADMLTIMNHYFPDGQFVGFAGWTGGSFLSPLFLCTDTYRIRDAYEDLGWPSP